ncbi:class II aldolase/adducin family protein [Rubripirellula reticaptiva]|uniref:L-fuculose phosphate aldolase n=1 Tax=Rubripirellula reticaptiva TaxID=2528013 RepID=A0A5C6ENJ8_9BACT|nr:class II aldolase/adducin family protein [Rubripirellula reticaptiva]TWU49176.1 L-fuculose phosphate aldolase [Rubripirellula reticaptiva]
MNPLRNLVHPRDEIMQTMDRIYRYRMTTTSGGNLSIRDDEGNIWISPARVDKGALTRQDIVCVRADGTVDGLHPPSSEFPFHKAIYQARPDIRSIVHAHPVALVAFSICRQTPNTRLFHQAHSVCGKLGFAPYACPGSEQLGSNIAATFAEGCDSVILENHGVVVGGESLASAFKRFEAFEFAGKTLVKASQLGNVRFLEDKKLQQAANRGVDFDSYDPMAATPTEQELRRQLCQFVRRGCRQRLLISTEGSFSARVDAESFLITPTQKDRELIEIDDIVLVSGNNREYGKLASRAARAHQAIYRKHPSVQAIVFAHPVNATAFSVTDSTFDVRTIPESYVFLRDVKRVPYGTQYRDENELASYVSESSPAAILENDGVIVTGRSVLDTFDRLEVLESTAEAVINAKSIGEVATMPDAVIDELKSAFNLN